MSDQDKTSWEPILHETDLGKRLQLVRDLVNGDDDRAEIEGRLLRVFSAALPAELRREVESSLLRLRGGSVDESGYQVSDPIVHWSIYEDTWKLNPQGTVMGQLLWQARQWQNPKTAIWLARKILEREPDSYDCDAALSVLVKNDKLNPEWFLEYIESHCILHRHYENPSHRDALVACLNSEVTQQWDDDRKLQAVERLIAPFCKASRSNSIDPLVTWIINNFSQDNVLTALHKLLSFDVDPRVISYLRPFGMDAVPAVVSFLQGSQRDLYPGIEVGFELGLNMEHVLHALSDNPNSQSVGEAIAQLAEERERDFSTDLRKLNPDRYEYFKRCAEAWFRQRAEQFVREIASYMDNYGYRPQGFNEHFARTILSISRQLNDGSRAFGELLRLPATLPDIPSRYLASDMNRIRPLLNLFGPIDEINCDPLTGLTLPEPLSFEYDESLRFRYLAEYGYTADGEPLDKFIVEYTGEDLGKLIELEKERDMLLDEWAYVRAEAERRRQRERYPESWKADKSDRPPVDFDFDASAAKLEDELHSDHFAPLHRASEKALSPLAERGTKFVRIEPEALLGEFRPADLTARIYTGMIRLLASSPDMRRFHSSDEVESALRRIAEIHEAVHGQILLAKTCDGESWNNYDTSPYLLHETIATAYTRRFISQLPDNQFLMQVLDLLEAMLPPEYQGAELLKSFSGEELRRFVLLARNPGHSNSLLATMSHVFQTLHSQAFLLAASMSTDEYNELRRLVGQTSDAVLTETHGMRLVETCADGLRNLGQFPVVKAIVELSDGFKWPDEVQLAYWRLVARNDAPVGYASLRLRVELIRESPGTSSLAGVDDLHNTAALGLPQFDSNDPRFRLLNPRKGESSNDDRSSGKNGK